MAFDPGDFGVGIDGAFIIGSAGAFQIMRLKKELKALKKEERAKHPELEAEPAAPENQKD